MIRLIVVIVVSVRICFIVRIVLLIILFVRRVCVGIVDSSILMIWVCFFFMMFWVIVLLNVVVVIMNIRLKVIVMKYCRSGLVVVGFRMMILGEIDRVVIREFGVFCFVMIV